MVNNHCQSVNVTLSLAILEAADDFGMPWIVITNKCIRYLESPTGVSYTIQLWYEHQFTHKFYANTVALLHTKGLTLHMCFSQWELHWSWIIQSISSNKNLANKKLYAQHKLPLELMDRTNFMYYVFWRKCKYPNLSNSCTNLFGMDKKGGKAISYIVNDFCHKCLYM